jgi:hypothetical protein
MIMGSSGMKVLRSSGGLGLPFSGTGIAWKLSVTSHDSALVLQRVYMIVRYMIVRYTMSSTSG